MVVLWCCGARSLKDEDRFPAGPRALLRWFQCGRNRLGRMNKVWLLDSLHGGLMGKLWYTKAKGQGGEDRFPAGSKLLSNWFQSGRNRLGSCNRFEELNK